MFGNYNCSLISFFFVLLLFLYYLDTCVRIYFKIHVAPVITHFGTWLETLQKNQYMALVAIETVRRRNTRKKIYGKERFLRKKLICERAEIKDVK